MHYTSKDFQSLERFYRANLINSCTGYKPANLIGTVSENGITNVAIFSSVVHLGSDPALIGFVQRPLTQQSHTYKNIIYSGYYTINHVSENIIDQAHQTSARFDQYTSEFEICNLTPAYIADFKAPFVKESLVQIGLEFVQQIPIELNNTILMIGKIIHLHVPDNAITSNGNIDLQATRSICVSGLDSYHAPEFIKSLPYAKVNIL